MGLPGLARRGWRLRPRPWEQGLAQTERGASLRGTVTVLDAVAPHRKATPIPLTIAFIPIDGPLCLRGKEVP